MKYTATNFGTEIYSSQDLDEVLAEAYCYADCRRGDCCPVAIEVFDENGEYYDWK